MNYSVYPLTRLEKKYVSFSFESNNAQGTNPVPKMVSYVPYVRLGRKYFNLEFGDCDSEYEAIDDHIVTDNGDMRKVLKTVASTLESFFQEFPNEEVHIDGSDLIRREYYNKLIRDYQNLIPSHFKVQGHSDNGLEVFRNDVRYNFIVVCKL